MPSEDHFTQPHPECAEPGLWSAPDDAASEAEVSEFIFALARLVKPESVVETGTFHGDTTALLAEALRQNGRGRVYGLELDAGNAAEARRRLAERELEDWATVVHTSSLEWRPPGPVDFAFLDAGGGWHRIREFERLHPFMHAGTVVCVHDTARKNVMPRLGLEALAARGLVSPVWIRSPRGLLVAQPRWPSPPRRLVGAPRHALVRGYTYARDRAGEIRRGSRH